MTLIYINLQIYILGVIYWIIFLSIIWKYYLFINYLKKLSFTN